MRRHVVLRYAASWMGCVVNEPHLTTQTNCIHLSGSGLEICRCTQQPLPLSDALVELLLSVDLSLVAITPLYPYTLYLTVTHVWILSPRTHSAKFSFDHNKDHGQHGCIKAQEAVARLGYRRYVE